MESIIEGKPILERKKIMTRLATIFLCAIVVAGALSADEQSEKFSVTDIHIQDMFGTYMVEGQIANNSGESYDVAMFKLSFFDEDKKLLGAADIAIQNFKDGETVTFDGICNRDITDWKSYSIRLETSM